MSLDNVTPGKNTPREFNVIIEIPMAADPIKYEVDKKTGALFVDRFMMTIIKDRMQDMIKQGMTLAQVKAARPTRDYDARYGKQTGPWTTDMFVEAAYRSLGGK